MMLPLLMLLMTSSLALAAASAGIDWSRCERKNNCFAHVACKTPPTGKIVHELAARTDKVGFSCPIGLQNYFFSEDVVLLQFQVGSLPAAGVAITPGTKLALYHGDFLLTGCEIHANGTITVLGDGPFQELHKPAPFENRSVFESDHALCSIKLKAMRKFTEKTLKRMDAKDEYAYKSLYSRIVYEYAHGKKLEIVHDNNDNVWLKPGIPMCDAYAFKDLRSHERYHVKPIINRDRTVLDCDNYGPLNYTLYRKNEASAEPVAIEGGLHCEEKGGEKADLGQLYWFMAEENNSRKKMWVVKPEEDIFFCGVPHGKACVDPFTHANRPNYTAGSDNEDAKLSCPGGKWLINNKYVNLAADGAQSVCKRGDYSVPNFPEFYVTLPDLDEVRLNSSGTNSVNAYCFTEYDCEIQSELDYSECKESGDGTCSTVQHANGVIECKDGFNLLAKMGSTMHNLTRYTCNSENGRWFGDNGTNPVELLPGTQIACLADNKRDKKAALSQTQMALIIGGTAVFAVLLAAILGYFFYRFFKRQSLRDIEKMTKAKWLKMKAEERRKYAQFLFGTVTDPKPGTLVQIVHGLDALEMLLDTDTEDPEVWEEVWLFLSRLQGALAALDYSVHHSFTRYCYLAARRIVDRHGWMTPKRITKADPQGLIRCVAIQLLARCYSDRYYEDAEALVADGYNELGMQAVEQYPHCGLLWSLMTQVRQQKHAPNTGATLPAHSFDHVDFCAKLHEYVKQPNLDIPREEVIPQFESVSMQAAFALGCTSSYVDLIDDVFEMFEKKEKDDGTHTINYLLGMGYSMCTNPGPKIFVATRSLGDLKAALLAVGPDTLWETNVDVIVRMMVDYYRSLDAKRLQDKCMPGVDEEFIITLKSSQRLFEGAARKQMEDLRDWFATRIDIDELKKKPEVLADLPETEVKNRKRDKSVKAAKKKKKAAESKRTTASKEKPVPAPPPTSSSSAENAPPPPPPPAAAAAETAPLLPPPASN